MLSSKRRSAGRRGDFCIAAAQFSTMSGSLPSNVAAHAAFIARAAALGVDILVFPELSLCGYELPSLKYWVHDLSIASLSGLAEAAGAHGVTVVAGAPQLGASGEIHISSIVFPADGQPWAYGKRHLHPGEEQYVSPSNLPPATLRHGSDVCALAICAETAHDSHAQAAAAAGASVYLASVLVSEAGYAVDAGRLRHRALQYDFGVLMANHGGPTGRYASAGRSAFWAPGGKLQAVAPLTGSALVVARRSGLEWTAAAINLDI